MRRTLRQSELPGCFSSPSKTVPFNLASRALNFSLVHLTEVLKVCGSSSATSLQEQRGEAEHGGGDHAWTAVLCVSSASSVKRRCRLHKRTSLTI